MNIFLFTIKEYKELRAKEWIITLFDFFSLGLMLGTDKGGHMKLTIGIWILEFGIDLHQWNFNIVKFNAEQ